MASPSPSWFALGDSRSGSRPPSAVDWFALDYSRSGSRPPSAVDLLVLVFEALRQFVDVVRRPVRHFHAEMETHRRQDFLDLVE